MSDPTERIITLEVDVLQHLKMLAVAVHTAAPTNPGPLADYGEEWMKLLKRYKALSRKVIPRKSIPDRPREMTESDFRELHEIGLTIFPEFTNPSRNAFLVHCDWTLKTQTVWEWEQFHDKAKKLLVAALDTGNDASSIVSNLESALDTMRARRSKFTKEDWQNFGHLIEALTLEAEYADLGSSDATSGT